MLSPKTTREPTQMNLSLRKALSRLALMVLVLSLAGCISAPPTQPPGAEFLQRKDADGFQFRVMSWNIRVSLMFDEPERRLDDLARITRAVKPDIIVLQEAMVPGMDVTMPEYMNREEPPGPGLKWHFHYASDNVVLSRFPFRATWVEKIAPFYFERSPDFHFGQAVFVADLPDDQSEHDVFVIAMHNKSGVRPEYVQLQQMQSDSIVATVRKRLQQDSPLALPPGTPIIIAGDMNVIASAPALHFKTLVNGDIADEETWGPDVPMDWDGTDLADAKPSHNARGVHHYTWRDDSMPYPPGRFDRVLYTDSVASVVHSFVLNTTMMNDTALERLGLRWHDSLWNHEPGQFDHLPVVVDFRLDKPTAD